MVEASQDAALDLLDVDVVPTWLRFVPVADPGSTGAVNDGGDLIVRDLPALTPAGEASVLAGTWKLTHRRTGALPKHQIARELGPDALSPDLSEH